MQKKINFLDCPCFGWFLNNFVELSAHYSQNLNKESITADLCLGLAREDTDR